MATEVEHAAAWRAALETPLGKWSAYDYDDVPAALPNLYALVTVSRRFGDDLRLSGGRRLVGYRATTLAVGRTVDEARWVRDRIEEAVADQRITVDGVETTLIRFESENPPEPDDGRYSGVTTWTYAL